MTDEASRTLALSATAGAVALVVSLVLVLAIGQRRAPLPPLAQDDGVRDVELLLFAADLRLPDAARSVLARVALAAREAPQRQVIVSAYLAPEADAGAAAARRAQAVLHALEADGVPRRQLLADAPQPASGPQAWRVELRLR